MPEKALPSYVADYRRLKDTLRQLSPPRRNDIRCFIEDAIVVGNSPWDRADHLLDRVLSCREFDGDELVVLREIAEAQGL